jgi:hypothetical protein
LDIEGEQPEEGAECDEVIQVPGTGRCRNFERAPSKLEGMSQAVDHWCQMSMLMFYVHCSTTIR